MNKMFRFTYDPPRTTTREKWKAIRQWQRICENEVQKEMDKMDIAKFMLDLAIYGKARLMTKSKAHVDSEPL